MWSFTKCCTQNPGLAGIALHHITHAGIVLRCACPYILQAALLANEEVSRALNDYETLMRASSAAAGGPLGSTGGGGVAAAAAAAGTAAAAAGSSSGGAGRSAGQKSQPASHCWLPVLAVGFSKSSKPTRRRSPMQSPLPLVNPLLRLFLHNRHLHSGRR
jgi:hypothetical protein